MAGLLGTSLAVLRFGLSVKDWLACRGNHAFRPQPPIKLPMRPSISSLIHIPGWLGVLAGLFGVLALRLPAFAIPSAALVALPIMQFGILRGGTVLLSGSAVLLAGWYGLGLPPGQILPLVFLLWPWMVLLAEVLRRTGRLGPACLVAGALMLVFVLAMHTWTDDVVTFWHEWLQRALAAVPGADLKGFEQSSMLRLVNGFVAMIFGLALIVALMLGRWLQFMAFPPGDFGREFRAISLPAWVLALAVAVMWAGGLRDVVMLSDLLMVAILLYAVVGLAVIHGVLFVRGMSAGWRVPVYLLIAFFPPEALATLALIGVVDTFVHFRVQEAAR